MADLKKYRKDLLATRSPHRLKPGELSALGRGEVGRKLRLSEQYKHRRHGDVARRLHLHKNLPHLVKARPHHGMHHLYGHGRSYYHGRIHPGYTQHCFRFHYYGPSFFAGIHWYPRWGPWIAWSWNYYCHPLWDPRPLWCRPILYSPAPVWVYWQVPVWTPLPVVVSGTWVDVPEVQIVEPEQYDLQLLAVRFVDPGHPDEKLGPRYRVWFRNNSRQPITKPFDVMLFAGNDDRLAPDLPAAGVRVQAIEAGDVQSVDIRLPLEVTTMYRGDDAQPGPFPMLHVLVDANRAIDDGTPTNNGAKISREEVLSVDPAAFEVEPAQAAAGQEIIVAGEGFGPLPGQVLLSVAGKEYEGEITGWYDLGARFNVPQIPITEATSAELIIVRGDGAAANPLKIQIQPPPQGGPEFQLPQTFAR